ncbi:MAG: sigma-70 family RNA polymerase sigma factor [Acidobacteria bacterium]|nr:sigma-70 family RNA polymerase sigma factor [Acidobacteriota bacterium]
MEDSVFKNQEPEDVTELLNKWTTGDTEAHSKLLNLVYQELHSRAANYLRYERRDHTLQPTALVNEIYLKLINQKDISWQNRAQFYGVAAQMMRRVLVDHARSRTADKRGGDMIKVSIDEVVNLSDQQGVDLIVLDDALSRLAQLDARQSQIVELRFFAGLSVEETAKALDIAAITVMREWRIAKMWLYNELKKNI